jgi:DNA-binding MarR family transcriptional regulator
MRSNTAPADEMLKLDNQLCFAVYSASLAMKRLEASGYVARVRDTADERRVHITLSAVGRKLKSRAANVPECLMAAAQCSVPELISLTQQIQSLRDRIKKAA